MKILVTGISGFIGGHLADRLLQNGHLVIGLIREASRANRLPSSLLSHPNFSYIFADLRNLRITSRAMKKVRPEIVVHLAAAGTTDPYLPLNAAIRNNVYGTLNLLRACFEQTETQEPESVIIARTPGERKSVNIYAASKAAAWSFCKMYARTHSWSINGAMIFQTYGRGQAENAIVPSAVRAASKNQDFPMTTGNQQRDWIYVDDVASGITAMLDSKLPAGITIDIGTGKLTSTSDVVFEIYQLVGGTGKPLLGMLPDRPGEVIRQVAAAGVTEDTIGWHATISLDEGLKRYLSSNKERVENSDPNEH